MKRPPIAEGNPDHRLLRSSGSLADRLRDLPRLAMAEASAALAVADHHERCEAEALAALHGLGDAVDVDELLDELLAAVIVAATATTIVAPAAATPPTTAATRAARTASARLCRGIAGSRIGRYPGVDLRLFSLGRSGL